MNLSKVFNQNNYNILTEMVRTDFKLRYQGSTLGYLWSLLKPLMLFAVLYTVFTRFLRFGGDPTSLLLGIVLWSFFVEATTTSLTSIVDTGDLIRKIKFPKYLIVLSTSFSALINLLLNLVVVLVFVLIFGGNISVYTFLFFPLVIIELYVFTLAVSFIISTLYVKFRDVNYIWEVGIQLLFFMTPIIYPLSYIPNETFQTILTLNPLTQIIQSARELLVTDVITAYDLLGWPFVLIPFLIVIALIITATRYLRSQSANFAENV